VLVHHAKKRSNHNYSGLYEPLELDDLAYSGFAEFARQWWLLNRRERYDPASGTHKLWLEAGGSAGQGGRWGLDVSEGRIGDNFEGRTWGVQVRSEVETREETIQQKAEKSAAKKERADSEARCDARDEVMRLLQLNRDGLTLNDIKTKAECKKALLKETLKDLQEEGYIEQCQIQKPAGKAGSRDYSGYKLTDEGADIVNGSGDGGQGLGLDFDSVEATMEVGGSPRVDIGPHFSGSPAGEPTGPAPGGETAAPAPGEATDPPVIE
jgi:hypothetical protein